MIRLLACLIMHYYKRNQKIICQQTYALKSPIMINCKRPKLQVTIIYANVFVIDLRLQIFLSNTKNL